MRKKILSMLFDFIKRFPLLIIIISIILGSLFFLAFKFIHLQSDYIDLLPPKSEPVRKLKYLSEKLKGVGQFSVVIESKSKDILGMQKFADSLYIDLIKIPEIQFVQYKIPRDFIKNNLFLFIELPDLEEIYKRLHEKIEYELWKDVPFFINLEEEGTEVEFNIDDIIEKYKSQNSITAMDSDYMISQDQDILVMFIKPDFMPTQVDKTGELIKEIESLIKKLDLKKYGNDLEISFAGTYTLSYDQKNAIYQDIRNTSLIALVLIFLAILFFIRKLHFSVFLLYALGVGVLSAFGIAYVVLHHINLITGFLIAILTGLGVNYGIHFLFRYREETNNDDHENALKKSFITTGLASLTGALTTAVSFATLSFSKFLGFSEFGILASSGIMFTLLSTYIVVAALICFIDKYILKNKKQNIKKRSILSLDLNFKLKRHYFFIISIILIIITFAGIGVLINKKIAFEYNSKKLEVKGQKSIRASELIQKKFNISTEPSIYYTYDRQEEIDFYNRIKVMMQEKDTLIGNIMSISGVANDEETQKKKFEWIKKIRKEIKSLPEGSIKDENQKEKIDMFTKITEDLKIVNEDDLPDTFKRRFFMDDNGKRLYISQVFPKKILFDANDMRKYVKEIKQIKTDKKTYFPTGMHILYVFLIDTVLKESKIFVSIVFVIIWLLLLLDFKNFKDSLIAMIPLVFGVLWLVEIMSLFNIKFNFMNIIVLPTVLGTGVDNGVHIYHRYKESKNIFDAVLKTGIANLGMSLTVALGWSALFFAHYVGLKTMAFVGVAGILMTFVASITIMPAVILLFEGKGK